MGIKMESNEKLIHDQILKCPICIESFNNSVKPIIIPCGHTLCIVCVEKIIQKDDEDDASDFKSHDRSSNLSITRSHVTLNSGGYEYEINHEENSVPSLSNYEDSEDEEGEEEEDDSDHSFNSGSQNNFSRNYSSHNENGNNRNIRNSRVHPSEFEISNENQNRNQLELLNYDENNEITQNTNLNLNPEELIKILSDENTEKIDEEKLNEVILISCPTCRGKVKTRRRNLLINQSILDIINHLIDQEIEPTTQDETVFCSICKSFKSKQSHFYHYPEHTINSLDTNQFKKNIETLLNLGTDSNKLKLITMKMLKKICDKFVFNIGDFIDSFPFMFSIKRYMNKIENKIKNEKDLLNISLKENYYYESGIQLAKIEHQLNKIKHQFNFRYFMNKSLHFQNNLNHAVTKYFSSTLRYSLYHNLIQDKSLDNQNRYCLGKIKDKINIFDLRTHQMYQLKYEEIYGFSDKNDKYFTKFIEISDCGRKLYLLGKNEKESKRFCEYNLISRNLKKLPKMFKKLISYDKILYDNKLFILGGNETTTISNECSYFEFSRNQWMKLPPLTSKKISKSVLIYNNSILVFNGEAHIEQAEEDNLFETLNLANLNNENLKWENFRVKNFSSVKYNHPLSSILHQHYIIIIGGVNTDEEFSRSANLIDLHSKEVVLADIKLDKNRTFITENNCATYGSHVFAINDVEDDHLSHFNLDLVNFRFK